MNGITIEGILWLLLLVLTGSIVAGPIALSSCSDYNARGEAPSVGVVEQVMIDSDSGAIGGGSAIHIQIDGEIYELDIDGPAPAEGSIVKYRVSGDRAIDVEKMDVDIESIEEGGEEGESESQDAKA